MGEGPERRRAAENGGKEREGTGKKGISGQRGG